MSFAEVDAPVRLRKAEFLEIRNSRVVDHRYPNHIAPIFSEDAEAIKELLLSIASGKSSFFPHPEQSQFEVALKKLCKSRNVVPVSSCGTAIDAVLAVLDIGPGDEVITTGLTFAATSGSILLTGAKVCFADIGPRTLNITPETVKPCITTRTKAILPVHFAGEICDVEGFERLSQSTGIPVIYDAAHALGATTKDGRAIGEFGFATCLSFQFNKHITCLGEGGAIQ
jgi:perosamine synthetase